MKINEVDIDEKNFKFLNEESITIRFNKEGEPEEVHMDATQEMWENELEEIKQNPEWKCVYVMGIKQKNVAYPPGAIVGGPTYVKVGISKNPKGRMPNVERALKKGKGLPFLPDGDYEWEPMQLIGHSVPTPHAEEIERVFQKDFKDIMLKGKKDWYLGFIFDPDFWVEKLSLYKAQFDFKYTSGPLVGLRR